mgnify:FL=1
MRLRSGSILQLLLLYLLATAPALLYGADSIDAIGKIAELSPGLPPEAQSELYHTGETSRFYYKTGSSGLYLPETEFSRDITADLHSIEPNIGVETIYLFEAPGISSKNDDMLHLYNLLRELRSIKGIEYYSASRERMRTFFKEFYTIDGPETKNEIPDKTVDAIPNNEVIFAFQEDLTFGENVSRLRYRYTSPCIALSIENMEKMRYAFIPLIQEGNMQMHLIIYVLDGYIMFYGNCGVHTIELLGLVKKKKESFSNRIEAMYRWFRKQYKENILINF